MVLPWLSLFVALAVALLGLRIRGVGLGMLGALGLGVLTLGAGLAPASPPYTVLLVIMAVVSAASALEAAGSLTYLTARTAQLLAHSRMPLTLLSSLLTYALVWCMGTSHIIYPLLPMVARLAQVRGERPARALVATVLASQQAILGSPVSAASAILLTHLAPCGYTLGTSLPILLPATLVGTLVTTAWCLRPDPHWHAPHGTMERSQREGWRPVTRGAVGAWVLFVGGMVLITLLGSSSTLRQVRMARGEMVLLPMGQVVAMTMLGAVGLMLLMGYCTPAGIGKSMIFGQGMQAVLALLGVAWLGKTLLYHHLEDLRPWLPRGDGGEVYWLLGAFVMTLFSNSQGTTLQLLLPLALELEVPAAQLLWCVPAANSFYVLPTYPTVLAAMEADPTGSTQQGRWLLDHPFLLPGLLGTGATCTTAALLVALGCA